MTAGGQDAISFQIVTMISRIVVVGTGFDLRSMIDRHIAGLDLLCLRDLMLLQV